MSEDNQPEQPKQPEIEVTKELTDADKFKNEANEYFKSNEYFYSTFLLFGSQGMCRAENMCIQIDRVVTLYI